MFQDGVWKLHGLPKEVISDRGPQFVLNFMCGLSEILRIKVVASMAYYPQMDGQTECVNQEVEQFLCLFINQRQDDWNNWLSIAEFAYNNRVHTSTQTSPFMLDAGQNPQLGFEPIYESQLESLDNFASRMAHVEVKKILDSWILHRKVEYLVHWKGYGVEEDKWCPTCDVQGSKQLITKFHHTHPQAPRS